MTSNCGGVASEAFCAWRLFSSMNCSRSRGSPCIEESLLVRLPVFEKSEPFRIWKFPGGWPDDIVVPPEDSSIFTRRKTVDRDIYVVCFSLKFTSMAVSNA